MDSDATLQTLLDLNDTIYPLENGYWVKFEVKLVEANEHIPHGIRYSLTLHDKNNRRIIGFDNAHGGHAKSRKFGCKKITWDHKHQHEMVETYEFDSAGQLMADFWQAAGPFI